MEKLLGLFSIATLVFAVTFAGSSAITAQKPEPTPVVQRPLDAKALLKKIETLEVRLTEAQTSIDLVLAKLPNTEDSERDATRVRLDVLYRLESGLQADIAHTRDQLARLP
jgi:hypothetical protein